MPTELEASFDAFAVEARPRLRRLARAWCGDAHCGDDLVQEALVRLWGAWPRVRADGDPAGYARTTLVRVLISEGRRPWRRLEVLRADAPEVAAPDGEDCDLGGPGDVVLDAVRALPPRQRAVVLLRFAEDQSVAQVAQALGCSEGTVKSQASRALAALRAQLAGPHALPGSAQECRCERRRGPRGGAGARGRARRGAAAGPHRPRRGAPPRGPPAPPAGARRADPHRAGRRGVGGRDLGGRRGGRAGPRRPGVGTDVRGDLPTDCSAHHDAHALGDPDDRPSAHCSSAHHHDRGAGRRGVLGHGAGAAARDRGAPAARRLVPAPRFHGLQPLRGGPRDPRPAQPAGRAALGAAAAAGPRAVPAGALRARPVLRRGRHRHRRGPAVDLGRGGHRPARRDRRRPGRHRLADGHRAPGLHRRRPRHRGLHLA